MIWGLREHVATARKAFGGVEDVAGRWRPLGKLSRR